jgi:(p)ppGpp synthase/HD superfamily hydrolase
VIPAILDAENRTPRALRLAAFRAYEQVEPMNHIVKVMQAADFAARKHAGQRRKGDGAEPYMNHLVEVASLAAQATDGDLDVVIAALLHDAVEDQGATIEEIAAQFGPKVAGGAKGASGSEVVVGAGPLARHFSM